MGLSSGGQSLILCFLFIIESAHATNRIVVTLNEYNACAVGETMFSSANVCATVAKCYGRRLVLNVQRCSFGNLDFVKTVIDASKVVSVEEDIAFSASQIDTGMVVEGQIMDFASAAPWVEGQTNDTASLWVEGQILNGTLLANDYQWNLQMLNIYETWERLQTYGEHSTVAVLDSGLAFTSLPAFQDRILPGYDFISDDALSKDGDGRDSDFYDPGDFDAAFCPGQSGGDSWHGTKVTSVLGANYSGFLGVAPAAYILPVRVLGRCRTGYASDVADAIVWAAGGPIAGLETSSFLNDNDKNRSRVIIMAFAGLGQCPSFMQTAVDLAVSKGVVLYAAAGNDPAKTAAEFFPGNCNGVLSVGALAWNNETASYSAQAADVYMPGGDAEKAIPCLGADLAVNLQTCIGTSMAVPHAGGLEALVPGIHVYLIKNASTSPDDSSLVSGTAAYDATLLDVAAGDLHTCAIQYDSSIICWGQGTSGQLGNNQLVQSLTPVLVSGGITNAKKLALGDAFSCALLKNSSVACWGLGTSGQLGNGFSVSSSTPVLVSGISNAIQVDAGGSHACAVLSTAQVKCWGQGANGQLGNSAVLSQNSPVTVSTITTATDIACGSTHSCAELSNAQVMCWGAGSSGQLGNGFSVSSSTPVAVSGISNAVDVACGASHSCAALSTGQVKCWGLGTSSQMGIGTAVTQNSPVTVSTITNAVSVTLGAIHSCAVLVTGSMMCWGTGTNGRLGNGGTATASTPTAVLLITNAMYASTHNGHTCVMRSGNMIACWGLNANGQVGTGDTTDRTSSAQTVVATANNVSRGSSHTCAFLNGTSYVYCWGTGTSGQLGDGTGSSSTYPVRVSTITDAVQISSGDAYSCAVLSSRQIMCWGLGTSGQLGNGASLSSNIPVTVNTITNAVQVSAGSGHTCAVLATGQIQCWGLGTSGQLGNGASLSSNIPVTVNTITNAVQVAAGVPYSTSGHTCALLATGSLMCWGGGSEGKLGNGGTGSYNYPVAVSTITNAVQIVAGHSHSCALLRTGEAMCWGQNVYGEIGSSTGGQKNSPASVANMVNAISIGAGYFRTCAALATGLVQCWGQGNLGYGGTSVGTPTNVFYLTNVVQVTVQFQSSCALHASGSVTCWGNYPSYAIVSPSVLDCPAGTYGDYGSCTKCSAGKYSDSSKASLSSTCKACPFGKYSTQTGATDTSFCMDCPIGTYSNAASGASSCTACPIGTYTATLGNSACTACEPGKYIPLTGQTTCVICPMATYAASSGSTACSECLEGFYSADRVSSACSTACSYTTIDSSVNLTEAIISSSSSPQNPCALVLQAGIYKSGACNLQVSFFSMQRVSLRGAMGDTVVIDCSDSQFFVNVNVASTVKLQNLYILAGSWTSTPMISVAGALFTENVTFSGDVPSVVQTAAVNNMPVRVAAYTNYVASTLNDVVGSTDRKYYSFNGTTLTHTITFSDDIIVDILVVGGGGSGASRFAGGGGAGALIYIQNYQFAAGTYRIGIGAGGAAVSIGTGVPGVNGNDGGDTFITRNGLDIFRAKGGGGGSSCTAGTSTTTINGCSAGRAGGSSGGSSTFVQGMSSQPVIWNVPGQRYGLYGGGGSNPAAGNNGTAYYAGGGGGGAGGPGGNCTQTTSAIPGNGGSSVTISITGTETAYAGGGGGGLDNAATAAASSGGSSFVNGISTRAGGTGGKGATLATAGVANTGSGGGGSGSTGNTNYASGAGADGIVIIQFALLQTVNGITRTVSAGACSNTGVVCRGTSATCTFSGTTSFEGLTACTATGGAILADTNAAVTMTGSLNLQSIVSAYAIQVALGSTSSLFSLTNFVARDVVGGIFNGLNGVSSSSTILFTVSNSTTIVGNLGQPAAGTYHLFTFAMAATQGISFQFGGKQLWIADNMVTGSIFYVNNAAAHPSGLAQVLVSSLQMVISNNTAGQQLMNFNAYGYTLVNVIEGNISISNNTVTTASLNLVQVTATSKLQWYASNLTMVLNKLATTAMTHIYITMGTGMNSIVSISQWTWVEPAPVASKFHYFVYVDGGTTSGSGVVTLANAYFSNLYACIHASKTNAASTSTFQATITGSLFVTGVTNQAFRIFNAHTTLYRYQLYIMGFYNFTGNYYGAVLADSYSDVTFGPQSYGEFYRNTITTTAIRFVQITGNSKLTWNGLGVSFRQNSMVDANYYIYVSILSSQANTMNIQGPLYAQPLTEASKNPYLLYVDGTAGSFTGTFQDVTCNGMMSCMYASVTAIAAVVQVTINGTLTITANQRNWALYAKQTGTTGGRPLFNINGNYIFTSNLYGIVNADTYSDIVFSTSSSGIIANNSVTTGSYFTSVATSSIVWKGTNLYFQGNTFAASTSVFSCTVGATTLVPTFNFSAYVYADTNPSTSTTINFITITGAAGSFALGGKHFIARGFQRVFSSSLTGTAQLTSALFSGYFEISNRPLGNGPAISLSQASLLGAMVTMKLDGFYKFSGNAAPQSPIMLLAGNSVVHLAGEGGLVTKNEATSAGGTLFNATANGNNFLVFSVNPSSSVSAVFDSITWPPLAGLMPVLPYATLTQPQLATHAFASNVGSYVTTCDAGTIQWNFPAATTCIYNQSVSSLSCSASSSNVCQIPTCTPGQYFDVTVLLCFTCPAGTFSAGGSDSTACNSCPAGTYSLNTGSSVCTSCVAGTYSAQVQATSQSVCTACLPGKYSAAAGATSSIACTSCPAGTYSETAASTACAKCPAGKYSASTGANSSSTCLACVMGQFNDLSGESSCQACTAACATGTTEVQACSSTTDRLCLESSPLNLPAGYIPVKNVSVSIDTGNYARMCAILSGDTVACAGYNGQKQLGDGTSTSRLVPVTSTWSGIDVAQVSAFDTTTCVLSLYYAMRCFGTNYYGQFGDGLTTGNGPSSAITDVQMVASMGSTTCAIMLNATVMCWGRNQYGQVGNNVTSTSSQLFPATVMGINEPAMHLSTGEFFACAVTQSQGVKCWGRNWFGDLGDGTTTDSATAVSVLGLAEPVTNISLGNYHACVLTVNGSVQCWGYGLYGNIGDGATLSRSLPTYVKRLGAKVLQLSSGDQHICVLLVGGAIKCWGNNANGQIGDNTTINRALPVPVLQLGGSAKHISAGYRSTCAVLTSGVLRCWGQNNQGQLGDNTTVDRWLPITSIMPSFLAVASNCLCGSYSTGPSCALCPAGQYSSGGSGTSCSTCLAGSFSSEGSCSCTPCNPGTFSSAASSSACTQCFAGFFNDAQSATSCTGCPAGTFTNTTGSTACFACPGGSYASSSASTACSQCSTGSSTTPT